MNQKDTASQASEITTIVVEAVKASEHMGPETTRELFVNVVKQTPHNTSDKAQAELGVLLEGLYRQIERSELEA